ncbi:MAG: excinuclease ABC subunit UvrA [Anaerolineae bacterium]|nr:excinuclease ABC subunit UvrA [Anaerolineae bacterium]
MAQDKIIVRGAREHNLKNIDVEIPRDKLVVITGLSGSGKSSLAFDTIFAEGQRRYVESLSAYARQFLGQMEKPDVDQIEGLSPAVSIDQKGAGHNPRSTVGTVTEIYDYLRLLYARVGVPHCPVCGALVAQQSAQQIVEAVETLPDGTRIQILAPIIRDRKGHHQRVFEDIRKSGFVRARIDGEVRDLDEDIELDRYKQHTIEVVVDRLVVRRYDDPDGEEASAARSRLTDSIETALELADGVVIVNNVSAESPADAIFSERLACPNGHGSLPDLEPRTFSFNSPHGACPTCQGLGAKLELDPELVVPNADLSLSEGALDRWAVGDQDGYRWRTMRGACNSHGIPLDVPWRELSKDAKHKIMYGTGRERYQIHYETRDGRKGEYSARYEGVIPQLNRRYRETNSDYIRSKIEEYMSEQPCPDCKGRRLRSEALAVTIDGWSIDVITTMPVKDLQAWIDGLRGTTGTNGSGPKLSERDLSIGHQILKEISERASFMVNVGLGYLTLSRSAVTLSGGESQRIRLATQIGSRLTGVLYVLDEPSIGLHQRDNDRLLATLEGMRDLGNSLLVVEHDEETIRRADWIIDLGPGAGEYGGEVVAQGTVPQIMADPNSLTGAYLSGRLSIPTPAVRRPGTGGALVVRGARAHNLKNIDVSVPLGKLVCITGVSGSGKSTLLLEVLYKRLAQLLHNARDRAGEHDSIEGLELIDKIIHIDQSPIGRTPRSNPATYTKMFDGIRQLFAELPESKVRGYKSGRFSFNVKGGRCEACKGQGQLLIEMQFLPDIYIPCDVCHGARYNRETLQVRYKGKNIAEVLNLSVSEALAFFTAHPSILRPLETLQAVGLGYIRLGQPATTLSGGEAQRIKLSRELSKRDTGQTLYVLDEPSVGLHAHDVAKLIDVLQTLVDKGNTVAIIEHHPDIIKVSDWIIDLGPEGGEAGGRVIAEGTPEYVASVAESHTGRFLCRYVACVEEAAV